MKKHIKKVVPVKVWRVLKFILLSPRYYKYDIIRYFKYSKTIDTFYSQDAAVSQLVATYHVIEKGLAMPNRRLGYGKDRLIELCNSINMYCNRGYDTSNVQFLQSIVVLKEYLKVHCDLGFELDESIVKKVTNTINPYNNIQPSMQLSYNNNYFEYSGSSFQLFSSSRKSVRSFDNSEISEVDLQKAIDLARNSPSACNRQPSRVHVVSDKDLISKILILQGGGRGFAEFGDKLLIITSKLSCFAGLRERNEVFVNGGMYSMNLLYSLHHYKIAACTLNWSKSPQLDVQLRKLVHIPTDETVILIFVIGNPSAEMRVTQSLRS